MPEAQDGPGGTGSSQGPSDVGAATNLECGLRQGPNQHPRQRGSQKQ